MALDGLTQGEILIAIIAFQVIFMLFFGSFGTSLGERDAVNDSLAQGHDTATRSENQANEGWSFTGGLFGFFDYRYTMRLSQSLNHHYRSRLFERIQTLPMTAFDDERIGDAVYRVMYDTTAITHACYRILLTLLVGPFGIAITAYVLLETFPDQPFLAWSGLAFLPIILVSTLPFAALMRRQSARSRHAGAASTSRAEEGMANILAVQSLGGEKRQRDHFDEDSWNAFGHYRGIVVLKMLAFACASIPSVALLLYVLFRVSDLVIAGAISLGDFSLLFTYFLRLSFVCFELGGLWFLIQESAAGLQRVFFLMDQPGEGDDPGAVPLATPVGELRIEDVEYSYPDGSAALRGVDLRVKRGEVVALVGPAGAGKTTIAYLIPRFVDPLHGCVLVDGIDIRAISRNSLREQVAFVFQETVLFDASVEENIRIGRADASDTEVRQAAASAGADAFIRRLPQGYATQLGRSGGKLSVGQKQRLAIARALVRKAAILVLDEPTSAVDPATERQFVESLREASRDRLVLVIAHRLSTIEAADQILFVEDGRIKERGTHAELAAREGGAYRAFIQFQARGAA
jgi:ABC-type multidrug transport system fused ATPase/permease subunit